MPTKTHSLEFIEPTSHQLQIGAHTFTVSPLTVRELPSLLQHLKPALFDLFAGSMSEIAIVHVLTDHGDALVEVVALCARAEREKINAMQADQFMALAMLCAEVNVDFFSSALPRLKAQAQALAPTVAQRLMANLGKASQPRPSNTTEPSPA
jgi:hypothetical protein